MGRISGATLTNYDLGDHGRGRRRERGVDRGVLGRIDDIRPSRRASGVEQLEAARPAAPPQGGLAAGRTRPARGSDNVRTSSAGSRTRLAVCPYSWTGRFRRGSRLPGRSLMIRRVLLGLVLASTFVLLSVESVAAQSRAIQPPAAQPAPVELSGWETATLLRLLDLIEAELARRRASGDIAALRRQLEPASAPRRQASPTQPSFDDAPRRRSMGRTWGGVGLMVAGLLLVQQKCDGITVNDRCLGSTTWIGGSTVSGLGVSTLGVLLATVWADAPVAPAIDPSRRTVAFTRTVSW